MNILTDTHPLALLILRGLVVLAACYAINILAIRRRSAALRNIFWRWALVASLAVAVLSFLPAMFNIEVEPKSAAALAPAPRLTPTGEASSIVFVEKSAQTPTPQSTPIGFATVCLWLWVVVAGGLFLRWPIAHFRLRRLAKTATPIDDAKWDIAIRDAKGKLGLRREVRFLASEDAAAPLACGILKPTVFIPQAALDLPPHERQMILLHELAHIRRLDGLYLLLATVANAIHWPNPLAWLAARRMRENEERAADDIVVQHGFAPTAYAELLLRLAKRNAHGAARVGVAAAPMAQQSAVERRISRILNPHANRTNPNKLMKTLIATACVALATFTGSTLITEAAPQEKDKKSQTKPSVAKGDAPTGATEEDAVKAIEKKLRETVLPSIQFDGASIEEAVTILRVKSRDLDKLEADPKKRGVDFVLKIPKGTDVPKVSLSLDNVPLGVALKFITELANLEYSIEPPAVVIAPRGEGKTQLFTLVFAVPANFIERAQGKLKGKNPTAKKILEARGATFPDGASAQFNAKTKQLIVRNSQPNLEIVQTFIKSITATAP